MALKTTAAYLAQVRDPKPQNSLTAMGVDFASDMAFLSFSMWLPFYPLNWGEKKKSIYHSQVLFTEIIFNFHCSLHAHLIGPPSETFGLWS